VQIQHYFSLWWTQLMPYFTCSVDCTMMISMVQGQFSQ